MSSKTTTIKLSKEIKSRIDNLRVFPKESYGDILERLLEILNICRVNPMKARARLGMIERQRKINGLLSHPVEKKVSISIESDSRDEV